MDVPTVRVVSGKDAITVGCPRQEHTDGAVTETWQSLMQAVWR